MQEIGAERDVMQVYVFVTRRAENPQSDAKLPTLVDDERKYCFKHPAFVYEYQDRGLRRGFK
jgi:hypothetical protein